MLKLYIYHGRLALMGIYASLTARHLTYIYCIFLLCYTYCFKWKIIFFLSLPQQMCVCVCVRVLQRQLLEQLVGMDSVDSAVDHLRRLMETCLSNVTQLGSTSGDQQLISACLYELQVHGPTDIKYSI